MISNWTKYFEVPASFSSFKPYVDPEQRQNGSTVKPQYNATAFNLILPKEHRYFRAKKYIHSYLHVGNSENLSLKHNFSQSLEMRYSGVKLYSQVPFAPRADAEKFEYLQSFKSLRIYLELNNSADYRISKSRISIYRSIENPFRFDFTSFSQSKNHFWR